MKKGVKKEKEIIYTSWELSYAPLSKGVQLKLVFAEYFPKDQRFCLSVDPIVRMDLRLDVKDQIQQAVHHFLPILLEVLLKNPHLLLGSLFHLSGGTAVGAKRLR